MSRRRFVEVALTTSLVLSVIWQFAIDVVPPGHSGNCTLNDCSLLHLASWAPIVLFSLLLGAALSHKYPLGPRLTMFAAASTALGTAVGAVGTWLVVSGGDPDRVAIAIALFVGYGLIGLIFAPLSVMIGAWIGHWFKRQSYDREEQTESGG